MQLIKNEWMKHWAQRSPWILLILSIVIIFAYGAITKNYEDPQNTTEQRKAINEADVAYYENILTDTSLDEGTRFMFEESLLKAQYRLQNDLKSESAMSSTLFISDASSLVIMFVSLFMIIFAATTVSSEFNTGTIKMLLTRPVARWKILLSKLVTVHLYGFIMFIALSLLTVILGVVFWGTDGGILLEYVDGQIVEESVLANYWSDLPYYAGSIIVTTIFAFLLGSLFSSSTVAVSISLFILLLGNVVVMFLSQYEFAKYIWLANDFGFYTHNSMPLISDLTIGFSTIINIIYVAIFLAITFIYFIKRDITA